VAFATGIAGKFFKQFGITIAAAVLISLFEAFTFAPMLSAHFFKEARTNGKTSFSGRVTHVVTRIYDTLGRGYRPLLKWAVTHRLTVIAITLAIFALSGCSSPWSESGGPPMGPGRNSTSRSRSRRGARSRARKGPFGRSRRSSGGSPKVRDIFSVIGTTDGAADEATVNVKLKTGARPRTSRIICGPSWRAFRASS